jgi:hypothetical protein
MSNKSVQKPYWASVPSKEIADEILDRREKYYEYLSLSGRLDLYRRSWAYYYRPRLTGASLQSGGDQGELTTLSINHYRNLLSHLETMTVQQRAAFEPRATNSDVKSQSQVILAAGLLDYYMREKKLERHLVQAVKEALIYGEAFCRVEWDATSGEEYGTTATGATVYQGDIKFSNYTPLDCIRDFTKPAPNSDSYFILREFHNKYDLAAKYPVLEKEILEDSADMLELARTTTINYLALEDSDNIPVYTLIHKPTPALPQGRYTQVLDNGTVLIDSPLPYKEAHVYRIAPDEEDGTIFGYSVGMDLLPMQEGLDILYSTAMTNQATFGVQNILVQKGSDLSVSQVAGGLNMLEYDGKGNAPAPLNLTQTPAEIFNFMSMIEKLMETISGVNSVARGNPEASLKSGAALALVQSMAIQFSQNLQRAYAQLIEDTGTGTINILKDFAAVPRVAAIAGKSNRPLMKEFTGDDLNAINRVTVDMGNAMTRTTAGKVNLAESLMKNQLIENADQYIQVVTTGRLEPIIEGKQAQLLLIKGENENLAEGKPVRALITDDHQKHVLEHTTVLSNPEIRMDPNNPIVAATLAHIQEHIDMMNNPQVQHLGAILHKEVIPGPQPPQPQMQDGGTADMLNAAPPVVQQAQGVQQPNMPSPPQGADPRSAAIIEGQPNPNQPM